MIDIGRARQGMDGLTEAYAFGLGSRSGHGQRIRRFAGNLREFFADFYVSSGALVTRDAANGRVAVYIAGIDGVLSAARTAIGYSVDAPPGIPLGPNAYFWKDAFHLWETILKDHVRPNDRVRLYGHSAGGAMVEIIASLIKFHGHNGELTIDTFGAPCPGYAASALPQHVCSRQRWMNLNDPVPGVPFASIGTGRYCLVYAVHATASLAGPRTLEPWRCVQPAGGIGIARNTLVRRENVFVITGLQAKVDAWLAHDRVLVANHSLAAYRETLRQLQLTYGNVHEEEDRVAPVPRQHGPPVDLVLEFAHDFRPGPGLVVPIVIQPDQSLLDSAGRTVGSAFFEGVAKMFLRVSPKRVFKNVKVGRVWNVSLGDSVVVQCDAGRTAKTFTRAANRMLRAIGTDNTIFAANFFAELTLLFQDASTDQSVCNPLMRVDF